MTLTRFSWSHVDRWTGSWVPLTIGALAVLCYVAGTRGAPGWSTRRTWCFVAGVVVAVVSVESVIGVYDTMYFADHMIQHLLLIMVSAPLIAASAPLDLARRSGPPVIGRVLDSPPCRIVMSPIVAYALYVAFIVGVHLTSFFVVMVHHSWSDHLEQLGFVLVGYLFFRQVFGQESGTEINPGLRLVYVMAAVPADTITGLALDMSKHNPYPGFTMNGTGTPAEILNDVHLGGAIMWIGGDALMLLALIPLALAWVRAETVRTAELDARLDAARRVETP